METDHLSTAPAPSQTPQSNPSDQARDLEIQVDDQESSNKRSPIRSYDCIFCKKGFTNAQALGGHMNIHRKDRNKLKKPSRATIDKQILQIPHVITNSNNISQSHEIYYFSPTKGTTGIGTSTETPISQEFKSCGLKRAATWPVFTLPLGKKPNNGEGSDIVIQSSIKSTDHQEDTEVDLELRLGFKSSVGNETGTRRFF